jgi:hypothetical protein
LVGHFECEETVTAMKCGMCWQHKNS